MLNRDFDYGGGLVDHQLAHWTDIGIFAGAPVDPGTAPPGVQRPELRHARRASASLHREQLRAHCHNPSGAARFTGLYLEASRPLGAQVGVCKRPGSAGLTGATSAGRASSAPWWISTRQRRVGRHERTQTPAVDAEPGARRQRRDPYHVGAQHLGLPHFGWEDRRARFPRGAPVCLVTTTGRKSGQSRTAPLLYLADGERVVLVASKGGMSKHPVWYLNLVANPRCTVEIGREKRAMRAHTASAEEKAALWPRLIAMYPDYDDYQSRTDREIPVVVLDPVA